MKVLHTPNRQTLPPQNSILTKPVAPETTDSFVTNTPKMLFVGEVEETLQEWVLEDAAPSLRNQISLHMQETRLFSVLRQSTRQFLESHAFWICLHTQFKNIQPFFQGVATVDSSQDIREWMFQNPFMDPDSKKALLACFYFYKESLDADYCNAREHKAGKDAYETICTKLEDLQSGILAALGYPQTKDPMVLQAVSDQYEKRFFKPQKALLLHQKRALFEFVKETYNLKEKPKDEDDPRLESIAKRVLSQNALFTATTALKSLMQSDLCDGLHETKRQNALIKARGMLVGHFLTDQDLKYLSYAAKKDAQVLKIMSKPSWNRGDRIAIMEHLILRNRKARFFEKQKNFELMYKLFAPFLEANIPDIAESNGVYSFEIHRLKKLAAFSSKDIKKREDLHQRITIIQNGLIRWDKRRFSQYFYGDILTALNQSLKKCKENKVVLKYIMQDWAKLYKTLPILRNLKLFSLSQENSFVEVKSRSPLTS